jgi:hypothetical protein
MLATSLVGISLVNAVIPDNAPPIEQLVPPHHPDTPLEHHHYGNNREGTTTEFVVGAVIGTVMGHTTS